MNDSSAPRILVPLDLSGHGESAFDHGLAIALASRGEVHPLHVHPPGTEVDWHAMPRGRDRLRQWGRIPPDAGLEALDALGIAIRPHDVVSRRVVDTVASEADEGGYELIVMHTHARTAVGAWAERSISRNIARTAAVPVLFLPARGPGLVSADDGDIRLQRVLLPIGDASEAAVEVRAAEVFGRLLGVQSARGTLLRIGGSFPPLQLGADWAWETRTESGPLAQTIAEVAGSLDVDLIVMTTRKRDSLLDALRGSTAERVVDRVTCPVLVVPI